MTARHHIANGLPAQHRPFAITGPIRPNLAQKTTSGVVEQCLRIHISKGR
jgi:hypothetical protein